jgi:hypothetical protein
MASDFTLCLVGGCLPDFAGWSGYSPIAALTIDREIDAMGQKEARLPVRGKVA